MFIRIAICDDERAALDYISQTIETLMAPLGHTASIDCFPRSQLLLNALKSGAVYQIYFLDIEMPGMDGLELGESINQINKDTLYNIIYTITPDFFGLI
ncbi:MAG: response regulator [Lachnospiraceae bacterium]|nr:response regulator [Lachnospiraceae bacterium]